MADSQVNPIFGRKPDLDHLLARIAHPGLTVIAARPQQGKTRLLERLREILHATLGDDSRSIVGYYEGRGEVADLLLRSLQDLYQSWLSDSTWLQQARTVVRQQEAKWIQWLGKSGQTLANLLKVADPTFTATVAVQNLFGDLLQADRDLKDGSLQLPRLSYEQARDLLKLVHDVTKRPCVLMLDAFEQVSDPQIQAGNLHRYLSRMNDWPPVHFLLACREPAQGQAEDAAFREAMQFVTESSAAEYYSLGSMDLRELPERDLVVCYLREQVPATSQLSPDELLKLLDGYPGALDRWRKRKPTLLEELRQLTHDARNYLYRELKPCFEKLYHEKTELFDIAARISVLPEIKYASKDDLLPIALGDGPADALDRLVACGLLERSDSNACSFGLTARYERAQATFLDHPTWEIRRQDIIEKLFVQLVSKISKLDDLKSQFFSGFIRLGHKTASRVPKNNERALYHLITIDTALHDSQCDFLQAVTSARAFVLAHPSTAPFASLVFCGCLEHFAQKNDLSRIDIMLTNLRDLAQTYPDQPGICESLAKGLFTSFNVAAKAMNKPYRDARLKELRILTQANSASIPFRNEFAKSLFNTMNYADSDGESSRSDALLKDLKSLYEGNPEDAAVRKVFAMAAVNSLHAAKKRGKLRKRDMLLDDLRGLSKTHHDDPVMREELARALVATGRDAADEKDLSRRDQLLDELRQLVHTHADEPSLQSHLAHRLAEIMVEVTQDLDFARNGALLDELRELAKAAHDNAPVQDLLGKVLGNHLIYARDKRDSVRRNSLLDDLRQLATLHPSTRGHLATGIITAILHLVDENEMLQSDVLLDELRQLSLSSPDEIAVQKMFARGLSNSLCDRVLDKGSAGCSVILQELRDLAISYPTEPEIRECLANGLLNSVIDARKQNNLPQLNSLLGEFRRLVSAYPDELAIRARLSMGLIRTGLERLVETRGVSGEEPFAEAWFLIKAHLSYPEMEDSVTALAHIAKYWYTYSSGQPYPLPKLRYFHSAFGPRAFVLTFRKSKFGN